MPSSNLLTFSGERFFVEALARFVLEAYDPSFLPHIILPNNRSMESLKAALYEANHNRPLLFPPMSPLAHLQPMDWISTDSPLLDSPHPRLASFATRLAMATESILKHDSGNYSFPAAMRYAESLLELRDDCLRANIGHQQIEQLVTGDYAEHWQHILHLFRQVMHDLDTWLQQEGLMEPVAYQHWVSHSIVQEWQRTAPAFPVLVAGSTASLPSTAELLKAVLDLPQGRVILPGFDSLMNEEDWEAVSTSHPQYHMKQFLAYAGLARQDVQVISMGNCKRRELISHIMLPESGCHRLKAYIPHPEAVEHIHLYQVADDIAEAQLISLLVRDYMEHGAKRFLIISDDDHFARQLRLLLGRYGIEVNYSAGMQLKDHEAYRFMMLVAEIMFHPYESPLLLALLRHPYLLPENRETIIALAGWLDSRLLRGWHGMEQLSDVIRAINSRYPHAKHPDIIAILELLQQAVTIRKQAASGTLCLKDMAEAHLALMWQLCPSCAKDATHLLHQLANNIFAFAEEIGQTRLRMGDYTQILGRYFNRNRVAAADDKTAAVHILGVLEARLQQADVIIIPHMNEGKWPAAASTDPWLNSAMRQQLHLDYAQRQVGLAAHDISMMLCAPKLFFTRAEKERNESQYASRFYERLHLLLESQEQDFQTRQQCWQSWIRQWEQCQQQEAGNLLPAITPSLSLPPAPNPPLESRPATLSATAMESLLVNPFCFYVSHILRLREREMFDKPYSASEFGREIHKVMEQLAQDYHPDTIKDYLHMLATKFQQETGTHIPEAERQFMQQKLANIARRILEEEEQRAGEIIALLAEQTISAPFVTENGEHITFNARIDRIELLCNDKVRIIDYKTGKPSSTKEVMEDGRCQLLIAGLVWRATSSQPITALEYWELKSGKGSLVKAVGNDSLDWSAIASDLIRVAHYYIYHPQTIFHWNSQSDDRQDIFSHLGRVGEW